MKIMHTEEELKKKIERIESYKEKTINTFVEMIEAKAILKGRKQAKKQERERAESIFDDILLNSKGFEIKIWESFGAKNQELYNEVMNKLTKFFKKFKQKLKEND